MPRYIKWCAVHIGCPENFWGVRDSPFGLQSVIGEWLVHLKNATRRMCYQAELVMGVGGWSPKWNSGVPPLGLGRDWLHTNTCSQHMLPFQNLPMWSIYVKRSCLLRSLKVVGKFRLIHRVPTISDEWYILSTVSSARQMTTSSVENLKFSHLVAFNVSEYGVPLGIM